jgi:hypothetical protein
MARTGVGVERSIPVPEIDLSPWSGGAGAHGFCVFARHQGLRVRRPSPDVCSAQRTKFQSYRASCYELWLLYRLHQLCELHQLLQLCELQQLLQLCELQQLRLRQLWIVSTSNGVRFVDAPVEDRSS